MFTIRTIDIGTILQPGDLIAWLLIGLIAGWLANVVVRGRGGGCIGNIIVGLIGSFIGAILASMLDVGYPLHFIGTAVVSFIGAAILLIILRLFTGGR
jgi:uncharacterized membrane protein YeaQ/YmgE (transglycosylase-associated protein family)